MLLESLQVMLGLYLNSTIWVIASVMFATIMDGRNNGRNKCNGKREPSFEQTAT